MAHQVFESPPPPSLWQLLPLPPAPLGHPEQQPAHGSGPAGQRGKVMVGAGKPVLLVSISGGEDSAGASPDLQC